MIIYDEHSGFYDHVPTPVTGVPSPDDMIGPEPYKFQFDRLGVKVPAIFISPWIESGTVLHEPSGPQSSSQYEYSSIPATVKKIFNLPEFLTKRDAWAGTFEGLITRTTPRTDCPVRSESNSGESRKMVPKHGVGSFCTVDDMANVMTGLHNLIMSETSEYELSGLSLLV